MEGSLNDRMAEALERASVAILFVSRAYKTSANCRLEANYASQLRNSGRLQLVFVMMEADYHTGSAPEHVDGHLGLMVGDALWYRLWDASHVAETAASVLGIVGDRARLAAPDRGPAGPGGGRPAGAPSLPPTPPPSPSPGPSRDLGAAWAVVTAPE